jgi:hypothetical protein
MRVRERGVAANSVLRGNCLDADTTAPSSPRLVRPVAHPHRPDQGRDAGRDAGLEFEDPTVGQFMKGFGYATGQFGKNHLGNRNEHLPTVHGFDEFFGDLYRDATTNAQFGKVGKQVMQDFIPTFVVRGAPASATLV